MEGRLKKLAKCVYHRLSALRIIYANGGLYLVCENRKSKIYVKFKIIDTFIKSL